MQVRDAGGWKTPTPLAKDAGTWKSVKEVWARDAGVWKNSWTSEFFRLDSQEIWQSTGTTTYRFLGAYDDGTQPKRQALRSGSCTWDLGPFLAFFSVASVSASNGYNHMFTFFGDIRSELNTNFRLDVGDGVLRAPNRVAFVADAKFGNYTTFDVNNTNRAEIYSFFGTKLGQPGYVRLIPPS